MTWKWEGVIYVLRRGDGEIIATVRKAGLFWKWQRGGQSGFAATIHEAMAKAEVVR